MPQGVGQWRHRTGGGKGIGKVDKINSLLFLLFLLKGPVLCTVLTELILQKLVRTRVPPRCSVTVVKRMMCCAIDHMVAMVTYSSRVWSPISFSEDLSLYLEQLHSKLTLQPSEVI